MTSCADEETVATTQSFLVAMDTVHCSHMTEEVSTSLCWSRAESSSVGESCVGASQDMSF